MDGFPLDPADLARLLEGSTAFVAVEGSELIRVIGLGAAVEDEGVRVELISLELRAAGAILHWKARSVPGRMLGNAEVVVHDDQGTDFRAFQSGGGGSAEHWSGEIIIAPPPTDGSHLQIEIRGFEGFGAGPPGFSHPDLPRTAPIRGLWHFEVST